MDVQKQIEFLLQNQASHDAKIAVLLQNQADHDAKISVLLDMQAKNEKAYAKTQTMLAEVVESIDSLARIAHAHESRLTHLEGAE